MALAATAFAATACAPPRDSAPLVASSPDGTLDSAARAPDDLVEGRYVWGGEVETFRKCGDSLTFWAVVNDSIRSRLRAAHQALTTRPYQAIFLQARGRPTDGERGEFSRDYDGLFRIDSVLATSATIPTTCVDKERS